MCTWTFLSIKKKNYPHSVFSLFWRENILVGLERIHLDTTIYFPSSLPNQIYSKKVFILIFFPKFSIHFVSPSNTPLVKQYVIQLIVITYITQNLINTRCRTQQSYNQKSSIQSIQDSLLKSMQSSLGHIMDSKLQCPLAVGIIGLITLLYHFS